MTERQHPGPKFLVLTLDQLLEEVQSSQPDIHDVATCLTWMHVQGYELVSHTHIAEGNDEYIFRELKD